MAQIEPVTLFLHTPADVTPDDWLSLGRAIAERFKTSDGFVIFHGPDNLLYTATAISFLFKNLTKPIIFTGGSIQPQRDRRLEMRANLINAVQAASSEFSEVGLIFGNRFVRANQATYVETDGLNVFFAPASGQLGRIDFSIRVDDKTVRHNRGTTKFFDKFDTNVEIITLSPFIDFKGLARRLPDRHGIVINAGSHEHFPEDLRFMLEKVASDIPTVVWARKISPSAFAPKNMVMVRNMTWESTVTKFMAVRGETGDSKRIKEQMIADVAGEVIH